MTCTGLGSFNSVWQFMRINRLSIELGHDVFRDYDWYGTTITTTNCQDYE